MANPRALYPAIAPYPAPAPAVAGLGQRAAEGLAAAGNLPALYTGNARQVFQNYQSDVRDIMSDFRGYLDRKGKKATADNYAAVDQMISRMRPEDVAKAGPAMRDLYAEIDARSKGALAAFREIAIQAGWASMEDSQFLQDEAAIRLMGTTMSADLWDKVGKTDIAMDATGLLFEPFADDSELPANFTSETIARVREMPADQQLAALLVWRDTLVQARGNWFDIGVDNTAESRTNVLRVLNDLDKFMNPNAVPVEAEKWIDRITSVLSVVDSAVLIAKGVRASARAGSTLNQAVRQSARRRQAKISGERTGITPDAPETPPVTPSRAQPSQEASVDASRTAQEAQQGASAEGAARGVQGSDTAPATEAPTGSPAEQVAGGGNPEFQLDTQPGPFTKEDYQNFGTGGAVRQNARDRAAVASGEIPQGARVTREALQQAVGTEEQNRLAEASRNARVPRQGEPFISDSPQASFEFGATRVEPTISPRDPGEPVVTYRNMNEILREPVVGEDLIGPIKGSRPGEPFVGPVTPDDALTEQEGLGSLVGASALKSRGFAEATKTSQVQAAAQVIPGMGRLTDRSAEIGGAIEKVLDEELPTFASLKEELFNEIRRLRSADVGAYTATPGEVKRALADRRRSFRNKLKAILEAKYNRDMNLGMRKRKIEQLGDYEYEVTYDVIDLGSEDVKNPTVLMQKKIRVVLGEEDIREAGQSQYLAPKLVEWVRSPKSTLGMGSGRTVDLLVENVEISTTQAEAYRKIFAAAVNKVFKGLSRKERSNVNAAIMKSFEQGEGNLVPFTLEEMRAGLRFPDGSVISLNAREAQGFYQFYELTEANVYILNAMRTRALRANKVQRINFGELGDIYAREVGKKRIMEITSGPPAERPRIWNRAGAKLKDGSSPAVLDWDGPFGYMKNFDGERTDYTLVRLNDNVEVNGDWYNMVLVRRDEVLDIPDVVPHHPMTWIPRIPQHTRYAVTRTTRGTLNGIPDKPVKSRVIARAASLEEAEAYAAKAGNDVKVIEDNASRWTGDVDPFMSRVVPDDDYVENIGVVENLDPVKAVERSMSVLSKSISIDSFRRLQRARWAKAAKRAGVIQSGESYNDIVLKTKDITPAQKQIVKNLQKTKNYLDEALSHKTEEERAWSKAMNWIADNVTRGSSTGKQVARTTYSLADQDPIGWVQGITFHTQLGMNPSQFIVQSSNVLVASAIGYKDAAAAAPLSRFLFMQRAINYGTDPAGAFARQEQLARQAVKMGYFDSTREYHAFIDAVNASGRMEAVTNTADIAMDASDFNWMTRWKEKASDFNLFFYNQGVAIERAYSMSLAFLNYKRYLQSLNDTRKVTQFTRADWAQILTDQENLTLNMTKANKAAWQKSEVFRIPTQFMQVMAKFYETSLGTSRMISGEKSRLGHVARMMGSQLAFFGIRGIVPLGAGGLATMTYQMITGMTPEEHAAEDPETAKLMYSGVRNGTINGLTQLMFGSELAVSGRMSVNQGFAEVINDIMINDKSFASVLGGASGNWLSTLANGREEILFPLKIAAGEFDNPEAALVATAEGLDFVGGINNIKNAYDMYANHKLRSRSGATILDREFSTSEILAQAGGIRLQDALDVPEAIMDAKAQEERLTARAKQAAILIERAAETNSNVMAEQAALMYQGLNPADRYAVAVKVNNIVFDADSKFMKIIQDLVNTDLERSAAQQAVLQSNELQNQSE